MYYKMLACKEVCKKGRDDMKVNIQNPITASFSH